MSIAIPMPALYGITGRKRHGKDTFARMVKEARQEYFITHFAAPLKDTCQRIFGLSYDQLYGEEAVKEALLPEPIHMDDYLAEMRVATGLDLVAQGKVAESPRKLMQYYGTDYVRSVQNDYWIQAFRKSVSDKRKARIPVIVPDTRFLNEADAIHAEGGQVIKVVRIDAPPATDEHASELEIDKIVPDLLVGSRTGDLSLPKRIAILVAYQSPEAKLYDYRLAQKVLELTKQKISADVIAEMVYYGDKHAHVAISHILQYYGNW